MDFPWEQKFDFPTCDFKKLAWSLFSLDILHTFESLQVSKLEEKIPVIKLPEWLYEHPILVWEDIF